jgi:hypothetical protein
MKKIILELIKEYKDTLQSLEDYDKGLKEIDTSKFDNLFI